MKLRRHCGLHCPQSHAILPVLQAPRFDFRPLDPRPIIAGARRRQRQSAQPPPKLQLKMNNDEHCVESLDDLRKLVTETLCDHEGLEPGAFRLFERLLHRRGQACGIQFCLAGPRAVRLTAFWEVAKRAVLFYDSAGERFGRVELSGSSLELLADEQAA